jgi:acyl-CoA reductase-like NAD-dependent aldehyde dehydrogenase
MIAKRIAKLESHRPEPVDHAAALASVKKQLEQIAARRRAQTGWREPSAAERAAIMVRVAEAAARHGVPVG